LRATLLFPHRIKNAAYAGLVEEYLRLASRTLRVDLEVAGYLDRSGQVPQRLLERVQDARAVFLSERGKEVTSVWFKQAFEEAGLASQKLLFVIGDADGVPPVLEAACTQKICLSKLTMPHELALVVLAEQCWRAASMISGHPYHR
jgi:23S rRNA (pseudouridine1915-N3)-methyltransferase